MTTRKQRRYDDDFWEYPHSHKRQMRNIRAINLKVSLGGVRYYFTNVTVRRKVKK